MKEKEGDEKAVEIKRVTRSQAAKTNSQSENLSIGKNQYFYDKLNELGDTGKRKRLSLAATNTQIDTDVHVMNNTQSVSNENASYNETLSTNEDNVSNAKKKRGRLSKAKQDQLVQEEVATPKTPDTKNKRNSRNINTSSSNKQKVKPKKSKFDEMSQESSGDEFEPSENESEDIQEISEAESDRQQSIKKITKRTSKITIKEPNIASTGSIKELITIKEWEYTLEKDNQYFKEPIIPNLHDDVIEKFISPKSVPQCTLYSCPYCAQNFTYKQAFKTHLYTCSKSPNCEYFLLCAYQNCTFKSPKRTIMKEHYEQKHLSMTINSKKSAKFEKFNYLKIDFKKYEVTLKYYKYILQNYDDIVEEFWSKIEYEYLNSSDFIMTKQNLNLIHEEKLITLNPYEKLTTKNFEVINFSSQITALDWCSNLIENNQYLAISTEPSANDEKFKLRKLFESPNFIYIYKYILNEESKREFLGTNDIFAISNNTIGIVYTLKWRPDCGVVYNKSSTKYLGYLLATSSNGYAYIYSVPNNFSNEKSTNFSILNCKNPIVLKVDNKTYGQCISGDWQQLDNSEKIALGYSNGSILLFDLKDCFSFDLSLNGIDILPIATINAHITAVKTLKWSKMNECVLASGSLISREVKVWNINDNDNNLLLNYDISINDVAFPMFNPMDLFMVRDSNFKGENRLYSLNMSYGAFDFDKEQSRVRSSIFHTYTTFNSVDVSDLLDKCVLCDNQGAIYLNKASDTNLWIHKHKKFLYSFSKIAQFRMIELDENSPFNENDSLNKYNVSIDALKSKNAIKLDLTRVNIKENLKSDKHFNTNTIDLTNLTRIKWNQNVSHENLLACGSIAGFVFIHRINDLNDDMLKSLQSDFSKQLK